MILASEDTEEHKEDGEEGDEDGFGFHNLFQRQEKMKTKVI